jgi:sec-independent protein translocase protein TatA
LQHKEGYLMSIGIWQVVLILVIVLILFGAGKLPKVMGDVAAGVKNFKKGMRDDEDDDKATKSLAENSSDSGVTIERPSAVKDEAAKS